MPLNLKLTDLPESITRLPAFPRIISELLADLDDENSSMLTLARHVERDPVVTGRILSAANRILYYEGWPEVRDIYTAVSLIGFTRIREIVLTTSMVSFSGHCRTRFSWEHSLAVGISAQELAQRVEVNPHVALVAGLLHDVGQLWMSCIHPLEFQQARLLVEVHGKEICAAEKELFGFDHCTIGAMIARHWRLPADVAAAIGHHHAPSDEAAAQKLVSITHVAELIANALDLPSRNVNRVTRLSPAAHKCLGVDWSQDCSALFGAIEARYQYASAIFD
ncbi:MAG: HDOD domain-containing protein [Zoogloeaceae bacterium]|jgi:putative nucleotidyltransferase with HDIG domain|nr:HDOD domain-containing protein [Zoogloeaceae bacterium]